MGAATGRRRTGGLGAVTAVAAGPPGAVVEATRPAHHRSPPRRGGGRTPRPTLGASPTATRATPARPVARISAEVAPGPTLVFPTAAEAAAGTAVTVPTILDTSNPVVHLLRRITFGPTVELLAEVQAAGIDAWLAAQLEPASLPDAAATWPGPRSPRPGRPGDDAGPVRRGNWAAGHEFGTATFARQMWSSPPALRGHGGLLGQPPQRADARPRDLGRRLRYHRDVVRAHAFGKFSDMLRGGRSPSGHAALPDRRAVEQGLGQQELRAASCSSCTRSGWRRATPRTTCATAPTSSPGAPCSEPGQPDEGTFRYDPGGTGSDR